MQLLLSSTLLVCDQKSRWRYLGNEECYQSCSDICLPEGRERQSQDTRRASSFPDFCNKYISSMCRMFYFVVHAHRCLLQKERRPCQMNALPSESGFEARQGVAQGSHFWLQAIIMPLSITSSALNHTWKPIGN